MRTIHQGHLPIRTLVLIGMVILITAQAYAQNANARLTITLRNATLKEFVKLIENSTGYSFIYSEEISISHKINLKVKDMPLHEILDLVFKDEPISYKFSERYILLQKKRVQKPVSRKFTISGYVTVLISLRVINIKALLPILTAFIVSLCPKEKRNYVSLIWDIPQKHIISPLLKILC